MHTKLQNFVFSEAGADISHHLIQNFRNFCRILFDLLYHQVNHNTLTARTFCIVTATVTNSCVGGSKSTTDMANFRVVIPKLLIIWDLFILHALCLGYFHVVIVCMHTFRI